jgi:hypothetical protein
MSRRTDSHRFFCRSLQLGNALPAHEFGKRPVRCFESCHNNKGTDGPEDLDTTSACIGRVSRDTLTCDKRGEDGRGQGKLATDAGDALGR